MRQLRNRKGFTMAEMLIVVAIIGVLAAVSFVSIFRIQRTLKLKEMDDFAKEIFVAAQNHLAMSNSQGLLPDEKKLKDNDNTITKDAFCEKAGQPVLDANGDGISDNGVYYFIVGENGAYPGEGDSRALDLMLPFASVDETVRVGGNYIIFYELSTANVLDVLYANKSTDRFGYGFSAAKDIGADKLIAYDSAGKSTVKEKDERTRYGDNNSVIGYYGGELASTLKKGAQIKVPDIEVTNAEKLVVTITNPNSDIANVGLKLIITGKTSKQSKIFELIDSTTGAITYKLVDSSGTIIKQYPTTGDKNTFNIVLDDITKEDEHFESLFCSDTDPAKQFISGENITVQAIAYNNTALTNIAKSSAVETNSLFASMKSTSSISAGTLKEVTATAEIANIRHLENLESQISGFKSTFVTPDNFDDREEVTINQINQVADLDWSEFKTFISNGRKVGEKDIIIARAENDKDVAITSYSAAAKKIDNTTYVPVSIKAASDIKTYDGCDHKIMNVAVNYDGSAGIFGTVEGKTIKNVLVYNNVSDDSALEIASTGDGNPAGGLVGEMDGGTIENCAAAVYVKSAGGDAGGLIGKATGTVKVTDSYSGGHTKEGKYTEKDSDGNVVAIANGEGRINVISGGTDSSAGGLIGDVSDADLEAIYCYSTCSVKGNTAGGFAGKVKSSTGSDNNSIKCCYATGLVDGTTKGAFIGSGMPQLGTDDGEVKEANYYYEMVNGSEIKPIGSNSDDTKVKSFDNSVDTYNDFYTLSGEAVPYDSKIKEYFKKTGEQDVYNYAFKTIKDLSSTTDSTPWLTKHYGDWPVYETFVINTSN